MEVWQGKFGERKVVVVVAVMGVICAHTMSSEQKLGKGQAPARAACQLTMAVAGAGSHVATRRGVVMRAAVARARAVMHVVRQARLDRLHLRR